MDKKLELLKTANGNLPRTEEEKKQMISEAAEHYGKFLTALGYDWRADINSEKTPYRVAKSFVHDLISGSLSEPPAITAFPSDGYDGIILQKNIPITSLCSHHNREIKGMCHISYIPGKEGLVIGLSKLNRLAVFYSRRMQIQEGMTQQIHDHVNKLCVANRGVAVIIEATHGCVSCRQLYHNSEMVTSKLSGLFFSNEIGTRTELFSLLNRNK